MRFKAMLPMILAVAVLCNSGLALACQVACDDAGRGTACHRAGGDGMAGMTHCSMCASAPGMVAASGMSCFHQGCAVSPAVVRRANVEFGTEWVVSPVVGRRYAVTSGWRAGLPEPPLYRSSSVSLHTILRV